MIEIGITIAFIGSLIAGILDLKTTEFPDDIPYFMIALGLFIWFINSVATGDLFSLFLSIFLGLIFGIMGWVAFKLGFWGDGDAAILTAIMFLIPSLTFVIGFIFNLMIISIMYLVIYSFVIGIKNEKVLKGFYSEIKDKWHLLFALVIIFPVILSFYFLFNIFLLFQLSVIWLIIIGMIIFVLYAKKVEKHAFYKRIPAKDIKEGDVLAGSKEWVGITRKDANRIKKTLKQVEIKEGVRFTIVFPITIALTIFLGNLIIIFL